MYSLLNTIRAFPSEGRGYMGTSLLHGYNMDTSLQHGYAKYNMGTSLLQISKGSDAYCTTSTFRYVHVRRVSLTSEMTRQARFPM
jgi:hypothetical protein